MKSNKFRYEIRRGDYRYAGQGHLGKFVAVGSKWKMKTYLKLLVVKSGTYYLRDLKTHKTIMTKTKHGIERG